MSRRSSLNAVRVIAAGPSESRDVSGRLAVSTTGAWSVCLWSLGTSCDVSRKAPRVYLGLVVASC